MTKSKKLVAMLVIIALLMSNIILLLSNVSFAIKNDVTVEIGTDNDGGTTLSNDGKTLTYTCSDNSSYQFQLVKDGEPIQLTKYPDPVNGDKYKVTGIQSNQDLKIYSPDLNMGKVLVYYNGNSIGMYRENEDVNANYYSQPLENLDDVNNYGFRLQEVHQGENQQQQDLSNVDFTVDFRPGTWTIEGQTTAATVAGVNNITTAPVGIKGNTQITLSNWNDDLMEAYIVVEDPGRENFTTTLNVDQNGVTSIMNKNAAHLPSNNIVEFGVKRRSGPEDNPQPQQSIEETVYTVDFGSASWEVRGKTATVTVEGENLTNGEVEIRGDKVIRIDNFDSKLMEAVIRVVEEGREPEEWFSTKLDVNANGETCIANARTNGNLPNDKPLVFEVQRRTTDGPEYNLPPADTTAKVVVTGAEGSKVPYINARIAINEFGIWLDDPEQNPNGNQIQENVTIDNFEYAYKKDNGEYVYKEGKVKIRFSSIFLYKYVGQVKVIGKTLNANQELEVSYNIPVNVADKIDYSNRTDWLNHYRYQEVGFEIEVDKADEYDIEVCLDEMEGKDIAIGNFLWSDEEQEVGKDGYIGNATLELQKVVYELDLNNNGKYDGGDEEITVLVDENGNFEDPYNYIEYFPYGSTGSLVVPEGALCTMKITPDYGYQVLTFGSNDNPIVTGEVSEFTFPAHKGNFHLGAKVIAVDDVVDAQSEKVKSGTIELGDKEIDSGTVVLTVSDAEPGAGKVAKFEEKAGDYTINSYLDIDLDKVIYKGTEDDVWSERLHELNNEATITLKLEEGVDGNNIIIIHNVNDGDVYEIIEIESYDSEANTITFKTKSFSGYAIAVKSDDTESENLNEQNNPKEPVVKKQKYTITNGDFTVIFSNDKGHQFELNVIELMNLTDEQLVEFNLTREEYEQAKKELIERLNSYGTILNVYDITVDDENNGGSHTGEVTFKIKITEEMKKYNTFKLICIDEDTIGKNDVIDLKIEGDYLVGNLYHLSTYALVGTNVAEDFENPKTEDNIIMVISIFGIATFGAYITFKMDKKHKTRKH